MANIPANKLNYKDVIRVAEVNNTLFGAFIADPRFNHADPEGTIKPLFYSADFVKNTIQRYIAPLLPEEAIYKSPRIFNPWCFESGPEHNLPEGPESFSGSNEQPGDDWLFDGRNWPKDLFTSERNRELFSDAVGRTFMLSWMINNPGDGAMLGGSFDWDSSPYVKQLTQHIVQCDGKLRPKKPKNQEAKTSS